MVGWEYPPMNTGGLGVACQGIVEHLVDAGQEVVLVLPQEVSPKENTLMYMTPKGHTYKVIYVISTVTPYPEMPGSRYRESIMNDVYEYAGKVFAAARDEEFDIIHIHDWLTVPAGIALKKKSGKPLVMHIHSTEYDRTAGGDANKRVEEVERQGYEGADRLVAVSGYTKSILVDKYGVSGDKIDVVHNGIDVPSKKNSKPDFMGDAPVVIFVGRLTVQKGVEFFIVMASQVLKERPDTVFVIAGDGDMQKYLVEYSAMSQLTGSVLFSGFLRDIGKDELYRRADVLVMPSVSEPFGLVALEGAAVGVPSIISKTSGVAEVLPSAKKVDFWDTDLTAKFVLELINNPEERKSLGEKSRMETMAITWDRAAVSLKRIYQQLYDNHA